MEQETRFASMRPRQSSLGIKRASRPRAPTVPSFNEAEAIKPRNPDPRHCMAVHRLASMRPRQSSLGIRREAVTTAKQTGTLQ